MKRLLQFLTLPLLFMQNYNFNVYDSSFLPKFTSSNGNGHRTPTVCFYNKVTKRRKNNKIARASRNINFR